MMMVLKWLCNGRLSLQQVIQSIWVTLPAAWPVSAVRHPSQQQPVSASVSVKAQRKLLTRKLIRKKKSRPSRLFFVFLCVLGPENCISSHIRWAAAGNKHVHACAGVKCCFFFTFKPIPESPNYQIFEPGPLVIPLGLFRHTPSIPEIKAATFGSITSVSSLHSTCSLSLRIWSKKTRNSPWT